MAPPYLLLTVSRAKLEQKQGYSRPASRRNLQDARCQGDLRLCPHLSPPSGESHTLAESGAVLRRTAVQAGPSFVLVTPMSVSPDPAGLGVGGCHVFLALSPDPGTVQNYLRLGLPGVTRGGRHSCCSCWRDSRQGGAARRDLQAGCPSIFLYLTICSPRQQSARWDSASLATRWVSWEHTGSDPRQTHVTPGR